MTTYVYENQEVKLTGRQAKKQSRTAKRARLPDRVDVVVEIQPTADPNLWSRWVKMEDLYEVVPPEPIMPENTNHLEILSN